MIPKKALCFVATVDFAINAFLIDHIKKLEEIYDVTVITNTNNINFLLDQGVQAKVINLEITRKINLSSDFYTLMKLILIFRKNRFYAVHSITPKAGLLAMMAAFLMQVPLRIHSFTGQVWIMSSGPRLFLLKSVDKLIGVLSTYNLIDSPSQRDFLIKERIVSERKSFVFGSGSIAGVNLSKFKPNKRLGKSVRNRLGLPENAFVFLYLGRLVKDKGVLDLAAAFSHLSSSNAYLLFVGSDEDKLSNRIDEICAHKIQNIRLVGFTKEPYMYLASSDVICLPSYREGFGSVIIEAAAMGVPAIASNIYGITDAVIDKQTGLLNQAGDIEGIENNMKCFLENRLLVRKMATAAKRRAKIEFDSRAVTEAWVDFYRNHICDERVC